LRFPTERLREINRIVEETAWGGYRTEFYPTYDYKAAAIEQQKKMTGAIVSAVAAAAPPKAAQAAPQKLRRNPKP